MRAAARPSPRRVRDGAEAHRRAKRRTLAVEIRDDFRGASSIRSRQVEISDRLRIPRQATPPQIELQPRRGQRPCQRGVRGDPPRERHVPGSSQQRLETDPTHGHIELGRPFHRDSAVGFDAPTRDNERQFIDVDHRTQLVARGSDDGLRLGHELEPLALNLPLELVQGQLDVFAGDDIGGEIHAVAGRRCVSDHSAAPSLRAKAACPCTSRSLLHRQLVARQLLGLVQQRSQRPNLRRHGDTQWPFGRRLDRREQVHPGTIDPCIDLVFRELGVCDGISRGHEDTSSSVVFAQTPGREHERWDACILAGWIDAQQAGPPHSIVQLGECSARERTVVGARPSQCRNELGAMSRGRCRGLRRQNLVIPGQRHEGDVRLGVVAERGDVQAPRQVCDCSSARDQPQVVDFQPGRLPRDFSTADRARSRRHRTSPTGCRARALLVVPRHGCSR